MTVVNGYKQNDNEQKIDILNLEELEERAKQIIPTGPKSMQYWPHLQVRRHYEINAYKSLLNDM